MRRVCWALVALVVCVAGVVGRAQVGGGPAAERALTRRLTGVLEEGLGCSGPGERALVYGGLRELRDPALVPFFVHLAIGQSATAQEVTGIWALSDLEPGRGADLLMVRQIADPVRRGEVVLEAASAGLLDKDAIGEVCAWTDLPVGVLVELSAKLAGEGLAVDAEPLRGLLDHTDAVLAILSAAVLKQSVGDASAERVLRTRAGALLAGPSGAVRHVARVLGVNRVTAGSGVLRVLHGELVQKDAVLADEVLVGLLMAAPKDPGVAELVVARLNELGGKPEQVVFARGLLEAGLVVGEMMPKEVPWALSRAKDALLSAMGRALWSVSRGDGSGGAQIAALARGYPDAWTLGWALRVAKIRHWEDAVGIRVAVLDGALGVGPAGRAAVEVPAIRAVQELAKEDLAQIGSTLDGALGKGDGWACGVVLEGLLRGIAAGDASGVAGLVQGVGRGAKPAGKWPDTRCAALADLVVARGKPGGEVELRQALTELALGPEGAGLPRALRARGAWLALRGWGQDRVVLARVLGEAQAGDESGR